jgi:hypothetical protein
MVGKSLAAVAVLVLSGCLGGTGAGGGPAPGSPGVPVKPTGEGDEWTAWVPFASESTGCGGPCAGAWSVGPEFTWTGVDLEGRVLQVDYALAEEPGVQLMDPQLQPWEKTVSDIFAAGDEYGQEPQGSSGHADGIRVFALRARQLDAADTPRVINVLSWASGGLEPLGPVDGSGCNDCAATVLKAGGLRVEALGNVPANSGWRTIESQMYEISAWIGPGGPANPGSQGS